MKLSNEAKVGILFLGTLLLCLVFASLIGIQSPFRQNVSFYLTYNYAGGIEVGSPVRVSGIKVGKVEQIEFFVPQTSRRVAFKEPGSDPGEAGEHQQSISPLRLKISVQKDAALGIRRDSRYYVNMAGIIGERYIEVTPGTIQAPQVVQGDVMPGVDPPRFDQLISQSFDLAGKIQKLIDENKGDITKSIELLLKLSSNMNKTLTWIDKSALFKTDLSKLVANLISVTSDVKKLTAKLDSPESEKTLSLLYDLLWRLEPLDSKTIKGFFQKEGVRVHLF